MRHARPSQPSLFGADLEPAPPLSPEVAAVFTPPPARARATDPETSHEAAAAIRAEADRQRDEVLAMLQARPGLTSYELAVAFGVDRYVTARRLSELATLKLAKQGEHKRRCTASPKIVNAMTWWPVSAT